MITNGQVYDLESDVRRLENQLSQQKRDHAADVARTESSLLAKRRQLEDLKRKQRNYEDQARRDAVQKKMDDRRKQVT